MTGLGDTRYLSLATYRANGAEVATPMWYVVLDGALYMGTTADSGKVKRLRRSSRARVAPCDARGGVKGRWRDATARLVDDPELTKRIEAALVAKYGWQKRLLNLVARFGGRIGRRAWIEIRV